ncbi:hypothetical protein J27TS7_52700 [Paenibacillus dendritiformis]|uniref:DUF1934 domain-containing protein n=1 Tax=Paenibacillus dendritiformis TaxID=130049 RepID=UPI001B185842|nr:DUF1934 domain-containing protein [Paenibacillus dendritiformis]GIO75756.1 hypothetical protein J27TS7_52700 [Paenibacillus dendritiformis]
MSNDHTRAERVRIAIESRQDGEVTVLNADGELYRKGSSFYLLYKESASDMEHPAGSGASVQAGGDPLATSVTFKAGEHGGKLMRRGGVNSELSFVKDGRGIGYYQVSGMRFSVVTETSDWKPPVYEKDEAGRLRAWTASWSYTLYMEEERAGYFQLQIRAEAR